MSKPSEPAMSISFSKCPVFATNASFFLQVVQNADVEVRCRKRDVDLKHDAPASAVNTRDPELTENARKPFVPWRNAGSFGDYRSQRCWFVSGCTFPRQFMALFDGISHIFYVKVDSTLTISDKPALLCGYSKNGAFALCFPGWCSHVFCRYGPFCALQEYFEGVKASSSLFTQRATSTSSLGPRLSLRSLETPNTSTTKSTLRRSLVDEKMAKFHISRSVQLWCGDHQAVRVPGQCRTISPR